MLGDKLGRFSRQERSVLTEKKCFCISSKKGKGCAVTADWTKEDKG